MEVLSNGEPFQIFHHLCWNSASKYGERVVCALKFSLVTGLKRILSGEVAWKSLLREQGSTVHFDKWKIRHALVAMILVSILLKHPSTLIITLSVIFYLIKKGLKFFWYFRPKALIFKVSFNFLIFETKTLLLSYLLFHNFNSCLNDWLSSLIFSWVFICLFGCFFWRLYKKRSSAKVLIKFCI